MKNSMIYMIYFTFSVRPHSPENKVPHPQKVYCENRQLNPLAQTKQQQLHKLVSSPFLSQIPLYKLVSPRQGEEKQKKRFSF